MTPAARALWSFAVDVERFTRIHFMGFSAMWPILGAISVARGDAVAVLPGLLAITLCFHVYAAVLNDVVDLEVDRTQPLRAGHPLVRGALSPRTALVIALVQIPLAFGLLHWLWGPNGPATLALAAAFAGMAVYDLWGKRCPVPPLTDAAQGFAWAALALLGALVAPGALNALTVVVCAYAVGYLLLINGVHGGLRDLANDLAWGRRTTALFLGIRPGEGGGAIIPRRARWFCFAVQAALVLLFFAPLVRNDPSFGGATWLAAWVLAAILAAVSILLMGAVLRPDGPDWEMAFRLHLAVLLWPLVFLFAAYAGGLVGAGLVLIFFLPIVFLRWARLMLRRAWEGALGRSRRGAEARGS